ncbi:MAG: transglutaminase family protein, partial [Methanocellales archaeon]
NLPIANQQYEYKYNIPSLFRKINDYITPRDPQVEALAKEIAEKYPGKYNIYQICAIFDLVSDNIAYISEPEGEDRWQFPNETLRIKKGDCEDHAFLLASLIQALGGTTRIYATDNHVFASVYIGQVNHTSRIAEAINRYYGTRVAVYYQTDKYGSWLVLEPSGGFYAGSLPVGGRPTMDGGWTLSNTTTLYAFDAELD